MNLIVRKRISAPVSHFTRLAIGRSYRKRRSLPVGLWQFFGGYDGRSCVYTEGLRGWSIDCWTTLQLNEVVQLLGSIFHQATRSRYSVLLRSRSDEADV